MRKPELADYNLAPADVERAKNAKGRQRHFAVMVLPLFYLVGPLTVGYRAYLSDQSIVLAALIGLFVGIPLALFGGAVTMGLWEVIWAATNRLDHDVLKRHEKYGAALKAFEQHQERLLESFWTNLSGLSFEHELALLFKDLGYQVQLTPVGRDGGIDIFLNQSSKSTIVQCKRYSSPVGVAVARELYGVLLNSKADAAILACTGGFTRGVTDFVKGKRIRLLGLDEIITLQKSVGYKLET